MFLGLCFQYHLHPMRILGVKSHVLPSFHRVYVNTESLRGRIVPLPYKACMHLLLPSYGVSLQALSLLYPAKCSLLSQVLIHAWHTPLLAAFLKQAQ